jgi:N-acetylglucosaminyldiphosphoundecaprenol N-acetyl-beta-D-mannosaminyltransferase
MNAETRPLQCPKTPRKGPSPPAIESRRILGMRVDCTDYEQAVEMITTLAGEEDGSYVCVASVHMVMEARDDPEFQRIVNAAGLVTSDGVPLVWALRWLGLEKAKRVYGPTLTPKVCARAAAARIPVGFYGGTPEILGALEERIHADSPDLRIAFRFAPPFRLHTEEEDQALVESIEDSGVEILFVGLGCPKQESWMAEHRDRLSCVMVGVGAAFDFIAGAKSQAPPWMQRNGLEWLFRMATEPRRLSRRYLNIVPRFLWSFGRQLWSEKRKRRVHAKVRTAQGSRAATQSTGESK